jgi:hypothetical protein
MTNASDFDRDIFALTNQIRTDPQSFIPALQEYADKFQDEVYVRRGAGRSKIKTTDGIAAVH